MRIIQVGRIKAAAGTADRIYFNPPGGAVASEKWRLRAIQLIPNQALTTNATDYVTVSAFKGASTAVVTSRVTSSTGFTQGTPENLTITATGVDQEIGGTDPLSVRVAHSGSGKDVDLSVEVEFEAVRY